MPEKGNSGRNFSQKVSPNCGVGVLTWAKLLRPGLQSFAQVKILNPALGRNSLQTFSWDPLWIVLALVLFSSLLFFFSSRLVSSRLVSSLLFSSLLFSSLLSFLWNSASKMYSKLRRLRRRCCSGTSVRFHCVPFGGSVVLEGFHQKGRKAYNEHIERITTCDSKRHIFTGFPTMWSDLVEVLDATGGARLETDTTTCT